MKKGKLDKLISNVLSIWYWRFKTAKQKMDTILSFISSKTFAQNFIPMQNTVLAEVSSKEARKGFLVKIRNKILLQTIMMILQF